MISPLEGGRGGVLPYDNRTCNAAAACYIGKIFSSVCVVHV